MLIWNKRWLTTNQIFSSTCQHAKIWNLNCIVHASQWPASMASLTTSVHKYKCSQWQRLRAHRLGWTVPFLNSDTFAVWPYCSLWGERVSSSLYIPSTHTVCISHQKKVWFILHGGDSRLSHVTVGSSVSWLLSTYSTWLHLLSEPWSKSALSSITRPQANNPTSDT